MVIEGAGSPAEINLKAGRYRQYGTWRSWQRRRFCWWGTLTGAACSPSLSGHTERFWKHGRAGDWSKGFVINKFRGDTDHSEAGTYPLCWRNGSESRCVGVIPYVTLELDDEDSLTRALETQREGKDVGYCGDPSSEDFQFHGFESPLTAMEDVSVRYVGVCAPDLGEPDLILLPGTKNTHGRSGVAAGKAGWKRPSIQRAAEARSAGHRHLRRIPDAGRHPR